MTMKRRLLTVSAALCILAIGAALLERTTGFEPLGIVGTAEARMGRPRTPVSVAGAGRRTVRRCAAGVYDC